MLDVQLVPLHEAARERYLSYALSVITSRALPDVRDGLKPVQRRILFTMFHELSLHPTGRYRKCAAVVGEVMGKFHPHGDTSIYEALVRMAQDFSLRAPLIDGQGNFGSLDGDNAAAMRYTECRLRPIAEELLSEIKKQTVDWRPNYDGQRFEPIVLPAQFPQLLVNGSEGIAVGMATRIPPHNLGEVIEACVALIDDRSLDVPALMKHVKGPDFPTGGQILSSAAELLEIYETGQGSVRLRGEYTVEKGERRKQVIITSVPYGQNKARIIERIGAEITGRKLPLVVDIRDESTDDVRVVLELKQGASPEAAMAYIYKHTPLEGSWPVNITALVPSDNPEVCVPERLGLKPTLTYWLDFRFETVRRRFEFELRELEKRIHILEGFAKVFDALDEAIAIIRKSEGRRDAAERLMDRFDLTEEQTDAILELRLYKLARMEIELIRQELEEKRTLAARIVQILASDALLWGVVRTELLELHRLYAEPRRTSVGQPAQAFAYEEETYIVKEDAFVVVTRDGWMKRQSSFTEIGRIRIREDDEIGWLFKAHTRSTLTFFTNLGGAYVTRVDDVPATTGYGEPLQRHFSFADGERVVGVVSHDARHRVETQESLPISDEPPPPYAIALTQRGRVLRFALAAHEEVSNKNGRRYARLDEDDQVFAVYPVDDDDRACVASQGGRVLVFPIAEVPILRASGKGVTGIKLRDTDEVLAFELTRTANDGPQVRTPQGREIVVRDRAYAGHRGARGHVVLQRGNLSGWERGPILRLGSPEDAPDPPADVEED